MATFTTGNLAYGSGGVFRLDLQVDDPPAPDYNTVTQTVGVRLYIITSGSISDSSGGSSSVAYDGNGFGGGSFSISHGSGGGTTLIASTTFTVTLNRGSTRSFTMSGSFSGIEGLGGSRSVSGVFTFPARPYGPPAQMGQPVVVGLSATDVTINWTGVDNGGDPGIAWDIQVGTGPYTGVFIDIPVTGGPAVLSGLTRATTYYVWMRQRNTLYAGAWGPVRSFTTLAVVPGTPATPTADQILAASMRINWTAPDNGGAALNLHTVQIAENSGFTTGLQTFSVAPGTLSQVFSGLKPSTTYYFRVRSSNSVGFGPYSATGTAATLAGWHYGVSGSWVQAIPHYGVGGVWVVVPTRYGSGGNWVS